MIARLGIFYWKIFYYWGIFERADVSNNVILCIDVLDWIQYWILWKEVLKIEKFKMMFSLLDVIKNSWLIKMILQLIEKNMYKEFTCYMYISIFFFFSFIE